MSGVGGKRRKREDVRAIVLGVKNHQVDKWESKKFTREKGGDKARYNVQYVDVPVRPVGVMPWEVGWYKELYSQCDVVSKERFLA